MTGRLVLDVRKLQWRNLISLFEDDHEAIRSSTSFWLWAAQIALMGKPLGGKKIFCGIQRRDFWRKWILDLFIIECGPCMLLFLFLATQGNANLRVLDNRHHFHILVRLELGNRIPKSWH